MNIGKIMDEAGLTFEEEVYYANHALIDICDDCGDWTPITNYHDGDNFLIFDGWFICYKCRCKYGRVV